MRRRQPVAGHPCGLVLHRPGQRGQLNALRRTVSTVASVPERALCGARAHARSRVGYPFSFIIFEWPTGWNGRATSARAAERITFLPS